MAKVAGGGERGATSPESPGSDGLEKARVSGRAEGTELCTRPVEALTPLPSGSPERVPQ